MGTHPIFESDFDCLTEMGAVKKYDKFVKKYLKKTGRRKTLIEFEKSLQRKQPKDERKPVKLSFAIQKAPEKIKKEPEPVKAKPRSSSKNDAAEKKALAIPDKFMKIAKKFGLPEEHLEFFYENRNSFHWESKEKNKIHCAEVKCKITMKPSKGCFLDHMKTVHNYTDIPCGKIDCSFIAFSGPLTHHRSRFHGHGRKEVANARYPCPYPSCKVSFLKPSNLKNHLNVHENRVYSCSYCQYRNSNFSGLKEHLAVHFNLQNFTCDICQGSFNSKIKLDKHKFAAHSSDFSCLHCTFSTSSLRILQKHTASCKERLKHSRIL